MQLQEVLGQNCENTELSEFREIIPPSAFNTIKVKL